jgi:hypothetical protein
LILPLAQFICSFAGSNMNVMIADISDDLDTTVKGLQPRSVRTRRSRRGLSPPRDDRAGVDPRS